MQLVNNIFILPLLATFGCYVYYLTELKTVERMVAEGATDDTGRQSAKRNLQRNLMVGVFLMYAYSQRTFSATSLRIYSSGSPDMEMTRATCYLLLPLAQVSNDLHNALPHSDVP